MTTINPEIEVNKLIAKVKEPAIKQTLSQISTALHTVVDLTVNTSALLKLADKNEINLAVSLSNFLHSVNKTKYKLAAIVESTIKAEIETKIDYVWFSSLNLDTSFLSQYIALTPDENYEVLSYVSEGMAKILDDNNIPIYITLAPAKCIYLAYQTGWYKTVPATTLTNKDT